MIALKLVCQWLIVAQLVASMLIEFYRDVNGRTARGPLGFKGVIGTLLAMALLVSVYWGAGAFDVLPAGAP